MADIHAATSSYSSGTNDTYTTLTDDVDEVTAIHQNGPASAIIDIETVLGDGSSLPGSLADLATRLNVALAGTGKLNDFSATTKTTFPGTVSEGCTGASSFTASQLIRMHASSDVLESSGLTVQAGTSGDVVTRTSTQTLTNKTLTAPTLTDYTNAQHSHASSSAGGILTGNAATGNDAALTGTVNDTPITSTASATITVRSGGKVHVTASCFLDDLSGTVSGIVYMRIYRDATSNVVARTPVNLSSTSNAAVAISVCGLDTPSAASHTYTVDFVRDTGGTASSITASEINVVAFTVV